MNNHFGIEGVYALLKPNCGFAVQLQLTCGAKRMQGSETLTRALVRKSLVAHIDSH